MQLAPFIVLLILVVCLIFAIGTVPCAVIGWALLTVISLFVDGLTITYWGSFSVGLVLSAVVYIIVQLTAPEKDAF